MDLYEYQARELLEEQHIPTPRAVFAQNSHEVAEAADAIGYPCVIKAQVKIGHRGQAGGVKIAHNRDEAILLSESILPMTIHGHKVNGVLVAEAKNILHEYYVSISVDRTSRDFDVLATANGGTEVEEIAKEHPESVKRLHINALGDFDMEAAKRMAGQIGFYHADLDQAANILLRMWQCFKDNDATLVEINPLAKIGDPDDEASKSLCALDAKISLDGNAAFRHDGWARFDDPMQADPFEAAAAEHGLHYVHLDGQVGVIGNGAGLVMSSLDAVWDAGKEQGTNVTPANFLDIGGGASAAVMSDSLSIVTTTPTRGKRQDSATIKRTLYFFWQITKKRPWPFALGVIATIGFIGMLTYANTFVMSLIVDRIQLGPVGPDQVWEVFGPYIIALILVNVVGQVCSKLQDYAIFKTEINGNYNLARLCFDTLSNQSMTFHTNRFGGSLVSQTTKFMTSYSLLVETTLLSLLPTVIAIVCTIGILAPIVPSYVAVLTVMLVIYIAVAYIMFRKITPLSAAAAAAQNRLSGVLSDSVTNILAVKTYGREDYERTLFTDASLEAMRADSRSMRATIKRGIMTSSLIVVIMSIVSIFTAGGNAWFGISAGTLVMMFTYTYQLSMRFNYINSMMQRINRALGDAAEMTRVLDEPRLVEDEPLAAELSVTHGAIDFDHLGFAYHDAAPGERVFEDLTLHIPSGQRVGLVGRSGSGKTTLTKLLLRLDDVQDGHVYVDGQDVSRCTQQSLRRSIAYVPQEALLFHRSIRENIAYGRPDATDEEIWRAARLANAAEFIERLPAGLDTMVGERGVKLSGGQRQRVAIARAILADAPILVLDEATSALDSESEALVAGALENLMAGRTSIVVAHRLSTVASLDRIVVLADGKIVEDGTHAELSEAGGEYERLWDRQTGAFLEGE